MTVPAAWSVDALLGSGILMLLVLALRRPARRWIGPRLGYALWALPPLRLILPPLPVDLFAGLPAIANAGAGWSVLAVGAGRSALGPDSAAGWWDVGNLLLGGWLAGAAGLLAWQVGRHARFRRRLLASAVTVGRRGAIRIVRARVEGPIAFGVVRRIVAVPHDFADRYSAAEQDLALAHEFAHHARGDLLANWAALAMLALHWWNPIAWAALRAFREDQEFAVDADVLARRGPGARPHYARVLAKAAGLGDLPICNLNPRANLKGRLMMLTRRPLPKSLSILGGSALALLAATTFAATVSVAGAAAQSTGRQVVTIGVKPDGAGGYALLVGDALVPPGARLPGGATLPADLSPHGGCDLTAAAKPLAMVIKGSGGITTYTVMCASARPEPLGTTLGEGLASLKTMRRSVAAQPASPQFPEAERRHALGAIDRSIRDVEATLARPS